VTLAMMCSPGASGALVFMTCVASARRRFAREAAEAFASDAPPSKAKMQALTYAERLG
jgi:hypothetical protein